MADAPPALGPRRRVGQGVMSLADAWGQKDPRALPPPVGRQRRGGPGAPPRGSHVWAWGDGPAEGRRCTVDWGHAREGKISCLGFV
jgi:hypothetical protein